MKRFFNWSEKEYIISINNLFCTCIRQKCWFRAMRMESRMPAAWNSPDVGKDRTMNIKRINLPLSWGRMCGTIIIASAHGVHRIDRVRRSRTSRASVDRFFLVFPNKRVPVAFDVHSYVPHLVSRKQFAVKAADWDETRARRGGREAAPAFTLLSSVARESTTFNSHRQWTTNVITFISRF